MHVSIPTGSGHPELTGLVMCVVVEASHQNDPSKTQCIWDLLSNLYSTNSTLSRLSEDRRRPHAAELVVAAWKARQNTSTSHQHLPQPECLAHLEAKLSEYRTELAQSKNAHAARQEDIEQKPEPISSEQLFAEQDVDAIFDLDFQDIDWSFWSSID